MKRKIVIKIKSMNKTVSPGLALDLDLDLAPNPSAAI
jgi:hypothetical protein